MESEVIAAIVAASVSIPTGLVAAGAAYLGARAQARGAHLGPINSIRRAAQRDAYAQLLTSWRAVWRLTHDVDGVGTSPTEQDLLESRVNSAYETLDGAIALVILEGPDHIAQLARDLEDVNDELHFQACGVITRARGGDLSGYLRLDFYRYQQAGMRAADEFVKAAQAHLNGDGV
ncbi:hypothetical protein [Streptomyces sp. NBC_01353]|uniref:hypothetical protein n=1 Tax=Streptomyces sp. NBC_01353 TaxID=2903835 RepID=UPI002E2F8669|nr:hypothetical protein [Streptomyces sp. NBC_01353]